MTVRQSAFKGSLVLAAALAAAGCGDAGSAPEGQGAEDGMQQVGSAAEALDSTAATDDKSITVPTASWWYTGVTAATVTDRINALGARLTNVEIDPTDNSRFTVTMVKNSGAYAVSGWWWYYGLTASQLSTYISQNQARLIDVQKYGTASGDRFAAVMVANTGAQARTWWWYHDVTASQLSSLLSTNGARLTSLKSRVVSGQTLFTVIMIKNAGSDAKAWWWYYNVTPSFVSQKLTQNAARLIDYERRADGNIDVVMVQGEGAYWWWYYGLTSAQQVTNLLTQRVARPLEVEKYVSGGQTRYAVVMLDNANPDTRRVERTMAKGLEAGIYGAYLKQSGGSVRIDVQSTRIFEPASAIKVVYDLYANKTEHALIDTANQFSYWVSPTDPTNKDVCPNPAWETNANLVKTTIRDGLQKMMMNSDNRATRGFQKRYGLSTVNAYIDSIGLGSTELRQILGCGFQNNLRNDTTLADLGKLYENVGNGTLLTGAARSDFYNVMLGGPLSPTNGLVNIINQEASALGKSSVVSTFVANTALRSKGGSYDICGSSGCSVSYEYIRSSAGRIQIPFKQSGAIVQREYVYGRWVNGLILPCAPQGSQTTAQAEAACPAFKAANQAFNDGGYELFRSEIRAALKTW